MAGVYATVLTPTDQDDYLSLTLESWSQEAYPGYNLFDPLAPIEAAFDSNTYTTSPTDEPGVYCGQFFLDWYYRIHLIPTALDVGNLLADQTRSVVVWNANFVNVSVSSFDLDNGDGIGVTPPAEAPYTMAPLSIYTHVVALSTEGPPSIDATMIWVIDGETYIVPITGQRVVVWPFAPNWSGPFDETLEWLTDIQTSRNGTEHRFALREHPRRIFEFRFDVTGEDTGLFENVMFGWSDRFFALPLWHEQSNLTAAATAGDTTVYLDTADRSFAVGGVLVLLAGPDVFEAAQIASVAADHVTLEKGLELDWPIAARAYPTQVSHLDGPVGVQYLTDRALSGAARFIAAPSDAVTRTSPAPAEDEYDDIEVYPRRTNWGAPVQVEFSPLFDVLDSGGIGNFRLRQRQGWPNTSKTHAWLTGSKAEATEVRDFFARRRGRFVPVWVPTGTNDFVVLEDILSGDTSLNVRENGYGRLVGQHPARRHVAIQVKDGPTIVRRITGYAIQPDGSANLTLDAAVGVSIPLAGLYRVSYAGLYRMASDAVTFSWQTTGVATVQSTFALTRPRDE